MSADQERFDAALEELRLLLQELYSRGLRDNFVVIGGQVPALERLALEKAPFELTTKTAGVLQRPFSMEPDLLFSFEDDSALNEGLVDALKERGFRRSRDFRWSKKTPSGEVHLDLFADNPELAPTSATRLPHADAALARPRRLHLQLTNGPLDVPVPDAAGFLTLKLDAFLRVRSTREPKDAFDLFAYVLFRTPPIVEKELGSSSRHQHIRKELRELFGTSSSIGTLAVIKMAGLASKDEKELLAADVVRTFESLLR